MAARAARVEAFQAQQRIQVILDSHRAIRRSAVRWSKRQGKSLNLFKFQVLDKQPPEPASTTGESSLSPKELAEKISAAGLGKETQTVNVLTTKEGPMIVTFGGVGQKPEQLQVGLVLCQP
jgi:hypothetical protein